MAPGTGTGVWVIRKQTRRKRAGQEDEITVHSTYFVMGENIYMAPAVGDVIGSRLVSHLHTHHLTSTNLLSCQYSTPSINLSLPHPPFQTSPRPSAIHICLLPAYAPKPPNPNFLKQAKSPHPCRTHSRAPAPRNPSPYQPIIAPTHPPASLRNPSTSPSATQTNTWMRTPSLATLESSTSPPPAGKANNLVSKRFQGRKVLRRAKTA
jgi:MED6 mediator sub complex component